MANYKIRYVEDGVLLGERNQAWFRLDRMGVQFRPSADYEEAALKITSALEAVTPEEGEKSVSVQIRVVRRRFDVETWRANLDAYSNPPVGAEAMYSEYFGEMEDFIDSKNFLGSELYIGVDIPKFKSKESTNPLGILRSLVGKAVEGNDPAPSEGEILHARETADKYYRALKATLASDMGDGVHLASPQELVWLMRKPYWGTYNCPSSDIPDTDAFDSNFVSTLLEERVDIEDDMLRVSGGDGDSVYTSFSSIGRFPSEVSWPDQSSWLTIITTVVPDAEVTMNIKVLRKNEVISNLTDLTHEVAGELKDAVEANSKDTKKLSRQEIDADNALEQAVAGDAGWVEMSVRVQLRAGSAQELIENRALVKRRLHDAGYWLVTKPRTQYELLLEAMPGGKRNGSHVFSLDTAAVGASGCMLSFETGSPNLVGPYIGYNVYGEYTPVFFNPNFACDTNSPPGTIIGGQPGRGKTSLALTQAYQSFLMGHNVLFVDPKADTAPLAEWLGPEFVRHIDMSRENPGLLDPFLSLAAFSSGGDKENTASEAQNAVVGAVTTLLGMEGSEERKDAISDAVHAVITAGAAGERKASMNALVDYLLASEGLSHSVGTRLSAFKNDAYGRLLFSDGTVNETAVKASFTIITLNGLSVPDVSMARSEYTGEHRVGLVVMYLIMLYAQRMMMADSMAATSAASRRQSRKTIFIDEAWAVFALPECRAAAHSILRMGRSMGTASVFISQGITDIPDVSKYASTIFAFGCAKEDIDLNVEVLDMVIGKDTIKRSFSETAPKGTALTSDVQGRKAIIRTELWNATFAAVIDTTPGADPAPPRRR